MMQEFFNVRSDAAPEPLKIDEYSVWVSENIRRAEGGWCCDLRRYDKDEYIKLMDAASQKAQADIEYLAMMTEVELE